MSTIKPNEILITFLFLLFIGGSAYVIKQLYVVGFNNFIEIGWKSFTIVKDVSNDEIARKVIQIFTKVPIALAIIFGGEELKVRRNKLFVCMGLVSYELYIVHMPLCFYILYSFWNLLIFLLGSLVITLLLFKISNFVKSTISSLLVRTSHQRDNERDND